MIVPGSNLLAMALRVMGSQSVLYYQEGASEKQPNGVFLRMYAAPVTITRGQVQPVDRARYQALGLDFVKSYVEWFVPSLVFDTVQRGKGGDVIEWDGGRYQLVGDDPWQAVDGWASAVCVLIGPATGALNNG